MINTDNQQQQFFSTRWFQIGVLVALAVALMAGAAYFFGTGLRADTTKSVAASPIGSSLTNVRGTGSSAPASSLAILPRGNSDFSIYLRGAPAIMADSYQNEWMGFTAPESVLVKPSSAAREASQVALAKIQSAAKAASLAAARGSRLDDYYGRLTASSAATTSARLEGLAKRWAPFYAGLDKALKDAGARPSQASSSGMVESSAADPYQLEWMGFTAPESVQVNQVKPSAVNSYQWMKPEGIKPSAAANSAADQYQWIKPEGIRAR